MLDQNKQTPMQELIDWLKDYPTEVPIIHKSAVMNKAESLLEKEKEQIIDAYEVSHISMMTAEQYYNETFNTREK